MRRLAAAAAALVVAAALAGCADTTQTYERITVLEGGDGLALLCLEGTGGGEPPTCSDDNPTIMGWDWIGLEHQESGGVRWGEFRIVGEQYGDMFMMFEPPAAPTR
jgi:hypothetical protein